MIDGTSPGSRATRFFFMHLGGLVAVIAFFVAFGAGRNSLEALGSALRVALVVQTVYGALAWSLGELKQFDVSLWLMFAVGLLAFVLPIPPLVALYHVYAPAILFTTLGLTALLPPLFGYEPFTAYFARRQVPRWQRELPVTERIGKVMALFWAALFFAAAALCAHAPLDPLFTALYPNLLVVFGLMAPLWLPALYLKLYPPELPTTLEPFIMGMPMAFDRKAANGVRAEIQFRVSGGAPGNYWIRITDGRCQSFEGDAPEPTVTVHTPDDVWMRIVRGELDGMEALTLGHFRVEGDLRILAQLSAWFPRRLGTAG